MRPQGSFEKEHTGAWVKVAQGAGGGSAEEEPKVSTWKVSEGMATRKVVAQGMCESSGSSQGEGSACAWERGHAKSPDKGPSRRSVVRSKSIWDLCHIRAYSEGEPFQALSMADLAEEEPGAPYSTRWPTLKAEGRIWSDGLAVQEFSRGMLHPTLAKWLYCSPSVVLMDQAAKSLVWVSSMLFLLLFV